MYDVTGWIVYLIYIAIHLVKTVFEIAMLKTRKNGVSEEIIFYRRIIRRQNISSIRPRKKKNEV